MSEPTGQFLNVTKERTNLTHLKSFMLLVFSNKKAVVCKFHNIILSHGYQNVMLLYFLIDDIPCRDCEIFVAAYTEYLSDGLQVPSCGISAETLRSRYASLLWNYGIVKNSQVVHLHLYPFH